jgi:Peptidase family M28
MKANSAITLVTLLAVIFLTVARTLPPAPLGATAPASDFSAECALEHIRHIAAQPRPTGSVAYSSAREYVLGVLNDLGLETGTLQSGPLQDTLGWLDGSRSSDIVLLTAHLDSVANSPGATDDGSGVAVLLETARALASGAPPSNTVMFLFTDYEEGGYYGAKAFIAEYPRAKDIKVVIGFDAGGLRGPGVLSATSVQNGWLIRQLARADPTVVGSSAINALADSRTDFARGFRPAGFSGFTFDLYWDKRIHSQADNIENVNLASLQHQGYHALSLARYLGNLASLDDPREPDAVYFSLLRLFMVHYAPMWAIPMAIAVSGLFVCLVVYGLRRGRLTWRGMGYGVLVLLGGLILAPLPGLVPGDWLSGFTTRVIGGRLAQLLHISIIVLISLALTLLWYRQSIKIRKTSLPDLTTGALALLGTAMIVTSIAFPALSYALTWPLLFSLLASFLGLCSQARQKDARIAWLGWLISGVACIMILGPAILLGLFDQMALTLVFLGVLCGFLMPQIVGILGIHN